MEMNAAHGGGLHQDFPCSLLPGTLSSWGPPQSLVFRTEDVWRRCNQFIETAEFLIRVSPSHSYNAGRADGWVGDFEEMCTLHAVIMLSFWHKVNRPPVVSMIDDPFIVLTETKISIR